jgi:hypothetical protein
MLHSVTTRARRSVITMCLGLCVLGANESHAQEQAQPHAQTPAQTQTPNPGLTFEGDTALFTVAIKGDKTADFEQIMHRVHEALSMSDKPERKRQAHGWKVMRVQQPLPDGSVAYVHVLQPVVTGADYSIMQLLYDAFPDERQALYEQYRGAFAKNLSLATGQLIVDLSTPLLP